MKNFLNRMCLYSCIIVFCNSAQAWNGSDLDLLNYQFQQNVPEDIGVQQQGWIFYTLEQCFGSTSDTSTPNNSCWGANPDSPYGIPLFVDSTNNSTKLRPDEAIVYIVRTPPKVRYFSFIPYLHARSGDTSREILFASLDEPINNIKIVTAASPTPGDNVYDQLTVVVMTPDLGIYQQIRTVFRRIGFPTSAVQLLSLPPELLRLGQAPGDDSFTLLMRIALPENTTGLDNYIKTAKPVRVIRLTPINSTTIHPVPIPILTTPGSGTEPKELKGALLNLVKDIKTHYNSANLNVNRSVSWAPVGTDCIVNYSVCGGDNYDAVYTKEAVNLINDPSKADFVIVAGVNHTLLNKALYINHTISDPTRNAGVTSFTDRDLSGSAIYHAGVTEQNDPRNTSYQYLYAYAIAANCGNLQYCLEVPLASVPGQIGIEKKAPYDIVGRIYVDPNTSVRPDESELILPWVLK